ncbi:MAG: MFS transporter [Chloroflexota bacterium]
MNTITSSPRLSTRLLWLLTIGGFFSFFVFGFMDNVRGPTLPDVLRELNLNYGQGGTIVFAAFLGFLIATSLTGVLADLVGNKVILIISGICLALGTFIFSTGNQFMVLFVAMLIVGLGMGAVEVGGNALIVELHQEARGRYLNLLAVFHGIGALVVPIWAGQMLEASFTWRQVHQFSLTLPILLIVFFVLVRYPRPTSTVSDGFNWASLRQQGFTGQMRWFYLLLASYVACEISISTWLVEFLQQTKDFSVSRSTLYLSLFFAGLMLGRLLGSFIVDRVGYLRSILLAMIGSIVCLIIGIFGPAGLVFFVSLSGLFLALVFPTTVAAVSEIHTKNTSTILGVTFTFGGLGGALGPWIIGFTSDQVGLQLGLALTIVYCIIVIAAAIVLQRPKYLT